MSVAWELTLQGVVGLLGFWSLCLVSIVALR